MRLTSTKISRLISACFLVTISSLARPALAEGNIGEADAFCVAVGKAIVENRAEDVVTLLAKGTRGQFPADKAQALAGGLKSFLKDGQRFEGPTFLAHKDYGDSFRRAWYFVTKNGAPLYLECRSNKSAGEWVVEHLTIDSDFDKIHLQ